MTYPAARSESRPPTSNRPAWSWGNVVPATGDSTATFSIDEDTTRQRYTVALSHRPTGTVQIMLPNPDPDKLKLSTNRLVFKRDRRRLGPSAQHLRRCLA